MKKLIVLTTLLLVTVSLFAQDLGEKDVEERKIEVNSIKKNVVRFHTETLFVFQSESNSSWADGSWDYALSGVGVSYSRLFSDHVGITIVLGSLFAGVEDPFSEDWNQRDVDWTSGSYPFDIDRSGFFYKLGPYFRFGRFAITPAFEGAFVFNGDLNSSGSSWTSTDQLSGISCGFEFFVTESFLIYVEGAVLGGSRLDADLLWRAMFDSYSSDDDSSLWSELYSQENLKLTGCSLTLGVGLAF